MTKHKVKMTGCWPSSVFALLQTEKNDPIFQPTHCINHYPADKYYRKQCAIQWIEIYPVDSIIQLLNNWGLVNKGFILWAKEHPLLQYKAGNLEQARSPILPLKQPIRTQDLSHLGSSQNQSYTGHKNVQAIKVYVIQNKMEIRHTIA